MCAFSPITSQMNDYLHLNRIVSTKFAIIEFLVALKKEFQVSSDEQIIYYQRIRKSGFGYCLYKILSTARGAFLEYREGEKQRYFYFLFSILWALSSIQWKTLNFIHQNKSYERLKCTKTAIKMKCLVWVLISHYQLWETT